MPVLFIHGVNNRIEDESYKTGVLVKAKFLAQHLSGLQINGKVLRQAQAEFPYWGKLGIDFHWQMASLPSDDIDKLGPQVPDELRPLIASFYEEVGNRGDAASAPLLTLARKSLPKSVRALNEVMVRNAQHFNAEAVANFVTQSQNYAELHPAPDWLGGISTDAQFLDYLLRPSAQRMGDNDILGGGTASALAQSLHGAALEIKQALSATAGKIGDKTGDLASTLLLAWSRRPLNANLGRFTGDVFAYMDTRGDRINPGPIPALLLEAIDRAVRQAPAEPLVVIGHSLGGVIAFDLFSHFRPDIVVDAFVTVGSQVSHFEEIKRFKNSDPAIPSKTQRFARTPDNILKWINVFDPVDVFSYACAKVFDRVDDFAYDTETNTIKAHGAYLEQNSFYARLRQRLGNGA